MASTRTQRRARGRGSKAVSKQGASPQKPRSEAAVVEVQVPDTRPIAERVAERAYMIWLERGGDATLNWLEAEQAILLEG